MAGVGSETLQEILGHQGSKKKNYQKRAKAKNLINRAL
jgi:hypothetical protein